MFSELKIFDQFCFLFENTEERRLRNPGIEGHKGADHEVWIIVSPRCSKYSEKHL